MAAVMLLRLNLLKNKLKMKIKVIDILETIAIKRNSITYNDYSGRGMFGAVCVGITSDNVGQTIEDAASHGIFGAKWDSLGMSSIVYWPKYNSSSEIVEMKLTPVE